MKKVKLAVFASDTALAALREWSAGDRFASNWGETQHPGEWYLATIIGMPGKKFKIKYDSDGSEFEYTAKYMDSQHIINVGKTAPKKKTSLTWTEAVNLAKKNKAPTVQSKPAKTPATKTAKTPATSQELLTSNAKISASLGKPQKTTLNSGAEITKYPLKRDAHSVDAAISKIKGAVGRVTTGAPSIKNATEYDMPDGTIIRVNYDTKSSVGAGSVYVYEKADADKKKADEAQAKEVKQEVAKKGFFKHTDGSLALTGGLVMPAAEVEKMKKELKEKGSYTYNSYGMAGGHRQLVPYTFTTDKSPNVEFMPEGDKPKETPLAKELGVGKLSLGGYFYGMY